MNGGRKMSTNEQLLQEIIAKMGGVENIQSIASCMTRVRIAPITRSQVDFEGLKNTQQVLGVPDLYIMLIFNKSFKFCVSTFLETPARVLSNSAKYMSFSCKESKIKILHLPKRGSASCLK